MCYSSGLLSFIESFSYLSEDLINVWNHIQVALSFGIYILIWFVANISLTSFHGAIIFGEHTLFFLLLQDFWWLMLVLGVGLVVEEFDGRIELTWIGLLL